MKLINLIPRFVRLTIFAHIENQINEISTQDVEACKVLILARIAAVLKL